MSTGPALYTVAVRELCEFTAKQGDLDLRFTPSPSALEGMAGHLTVASRRGAGYQAEVMLSGMHGPTLKVRGRADGYDPVRQRLEEVKTYKGRLEAQPASHRALHWAQARMYGHLLCEQEGLSSLELALVYFHVGNQQETVFTERCSAASLKAHFDAHAARFLCWAEQQLHHRGERDAALRTLAFPFGDFRQGQRPLAEAVYKAAVNGRCLLAQAPTGIGKTMGTLFPLLKATPSQGLDKLFYLAAKTSGRQLALDALARLAPAPEHAPLRVLELVARDKACEHPDKACHGESCPLAQGFYDRLAAARSAACQERQLTQSRLREIALAHQVCPYYLSQEMVRWVDVVVGDYNYYFDVSALLHALTQANQWRIGVLVDEAHNLVERGRKMYSAELLPETLALARRSPAVRQHGTLKKALGKLHRVCAALAKAQSEPYQVHAELPEPLMLALQLCSSAIGEHVSEHPAEPDAALQAFYFEALHFQRMADQWGSHSLVDSSQADRDRAGVFTLRWCLRNVLPAPFLRPRLEAAHTSTLFSATLQPSDYYAQLLGLPDQHLHIEVESPFAAKQLQVHLARRISTRYVHRQASLLPMAELMARQYAQRPGNYIAFFSSYAYLEQLEAVLSAAHPQLPLWTQSRRMGEAEQKQFLARFTEHSQGIALAVLGGAFSEGVDLPGARLIGAFVATLGLPQVNPINEQIRLRMDQLFGAGYDYTYLYPGLQKVVQAAGRVIRTTTDEGVLHLMDDRYARQDVQALLPRWWCVDERCA